MRQPYRAAEFDIAQRRELLGEEYHIIDRELAAPTGAAGHV
jgi:hypothetical protein